MSFRAPWLEAFISRNRRQCSGRRIGFRCTKAQLRHMFFSGGDAAMPKGQEAKYKRCVRKVAAKGRVDNPHAVCNAALSRMKKQKDREDGRN